MKGSPIIATAVTIIVLLGLYLGIRSILLPEDPKPKTSKHSGHDHHSHDHHDHGQGDHSEEEHDDSAVETDFELYFSSTPKSLKISLPTSNEEIFNVAEFDSPEWLETGVISLEGHSVELQVDIEWETPNEMNMVEIILSPAAHAPRSKTLRNDDNISDIAEFNW